MNISKKYAIFFVSRWNTVQMLFSKEQTKFTFHNLKNSTEHNSICQDLQVMFKVSALALKGKFYFKTNSIHICKPLT